MQVRCRRVFGGRGWWRRSIHYGWMRVMCDRWLELCLCAVGQWEVGECTMNSRIDMVV